MTTPQLDPDRTVQDVVERELFVLNCTFDLTAFSRTILVNDMVTVLQASDVLIQGLGVTATFLVTGGKARYIITLFPDKAQNDLSIECRQEFLHSNGSRTVVGRSTKLNVQCKRCCGTFLVPSRPLHYLWSLLSPRALGTPCGRICCRGSSVIFLSQTSDSFGTCSITRTCSITVAMGGLRQIAQHISSNEKGHAPTDSCP